MFDIEEELKALGKEKHQQDETLRRRTVEKLLESRGLVRKRLALRWAAASAVTVMLAAVLLFTMFPITAEASYYTIDINPSIGVKTDAEGVILSVKAQNSDAEMLLADLNLTGMSFIDALRCVIEAAEEKGYLKDNGHVLVAHFGSSAQVSEEQIEAAVSGSTRRHVNVLLLQSRKSDYMDSGKTHQSAGISLLLKEARHLGIKDTDIDDVIDAVKKNADANRGGKANNGKNSAPAPMATQKPLNGRSNETGKPEKSDGGNNDKNSGSHNSGNTNNSASNGNSGNSGNNGDNENHEKNNGDENSDGGSHSGKDNKNGKGYRN